jgi:adenylate cyclase
MASTTRRLTAILTADIAGYSRLMGANAVSTVEALREHRAAAYPLIAQHGGRVVKTTGDGLLIEFGSVAQSLTSLPHAVQGESDARSPGRASHQSNIAMPLPTRSR